MKASELIAHLEGGGSIKQKSSVNDPWGNISQYSGLGGTRMECLLEHPEDWEFIKLKKTVKLYAYYVGGTMKLVTDGNCIGQRPFYRVPSEDKTIEIEE